MEISNAEFVISNTDVKKCPPGTFPEYAFIGRSNVGKSSLINMLTGRKGLAMTSATPGKTMLINHFLINKSWYIVDLPGYGYARRGLKGQKQIKNIMSYLRGLMIFKAGHKNRYKHRQKPDHKKRCQKPPKSPQLRPNPLSYPIARHFQCFPEISF